MNEEQNLQKQTNPALNIASVSKAAFVKTYVLTVSRYFPKTHKRAGEPTCFVEKILSEQIACGLISKNEVEKYEPFSMFVFNTDTSKIHTVRANYPLWKKRIEQVQKGDAILSIRYWSGKPYNSKQIEFCQFDKNSGVGIQKLDDPTNFVFAPVNGIPINWDEVAKNDGLSFDDFCDWFKVRKSEPMAIIHFTHYRY